MIAERCLANGCVGLPFPNRVPTEAFIQAVASQIRRQSRYNFTVAEQRMKLPVHREPQCDLICTIIFSRNAVQCAAWFAHRLAKIDRWLCMTDIKGSVTPIRLCFILHGALWAASSAEFRDPAMLNQRHGLAICTARSVALDYSRDDNFTAIPMCECGECKYQVLRLSCAGKVYKRAMFSFGNCRSCVHIDSLVASHVLNRFRVYYCVQKYL